MIEAAVLLLANSLLARAHRPAQQGGSKTPDPVAVARQFLPPNSDLATLYTFDYRTLHYGPDFPAVLTARVLAPSSKDIIFAYYSPRAHTFDKTLFVTLLHRTDGGYEKVYELSYRAQVLLVSKAVRIVRLRNVPTDAVAVIAGIGADLGGQLQIFVWHNLWGWQNVFPPNGSIHYFYFFPDKSGLMVALSASKHPGLNVSPPPVWFQWNTKRFVKISAPKGASKWPLPD